LCSGDCSGGRCDRNKAPIHGSVRFLVVSGVGSKSSVLVTGAIGDYGTVSGGLGGQSGNEAKVSLQKGSFEVNVSELNSKLDKAAWPFIRSGPSCSSGGSVTAMATLSDGSGLYKGISGTITLTETDTWVLRHKSNGKCTGVNPTDYLSVTAGSGTVSF
jgi:hypothetical protein